MPAVEAEQITNEQELASYELAFHVLPTIAEGEVAVVFQSLKDIIAKQGGEVIIGESPVRFNLAYEIIKYLEGRNRKFDSAYFGWVRFKAMPAVIEAVNEEVANTKEILRHLLIKLTKVEEENSFSFQEALVEFENKVKTFSEDEELKDEESELVETDDLEKVAVVKSEEVGEESIDKV